MSNGIRLPVNLASRPLRNHRLFRAILAGLVVVFLLLGGVAASFLIRASVRRSADIQASADLERRTQAADRERLAKDNEAEALAKRDNDVVTHVNTAIARKNVSWVNFFSRLENALPPDCSIAELSPLELSGTSIRVTMTVITPGLPGLLTLIQNLADQKFAEVTMRSETTGGGRLITVIGCVYEGSL